MIWVERLIALALILQTIEDFYIPPWRWSTIQSEFPAGLGALLKSVKVLLCIRLVAGLAMMTFPAWPFSLLALVTTWCINMRWRGTFNGGSDAMSFQVLLACTVFRLCPQYEWAAAAYVGIQSILSYFVAGIGKIINSEWRQGAALGIFLQNSRWVFPRGATIFLSWLVIAFECTFPLVIFMPAPWLIAGVVFHLANFYFFNLNRFFFAWMATYPAIYCLSTFRF